MGKKSKAQQAAEMRRHQESLKAEAMKKQKKQERLIWQIIIGAVALILILVVGSLAITSALDKKAEKDKNKQNENAPKMEDLNMDAVDLSDCTVTKTVTDLVRMNITYTDENGVEKTGDVLIRLYKEVAPVTVENFQSLVQDGFYDGLTFHRVTTASDGIYVIQGGDPEGTGMGGSDPIKGEMTNNGHTNNLSHVRGVISMARRGDSYNSGSSQFFIMYEDSTVLDDEYATFGYVVYGMETVDGISKTELSGSAPASPVTINYATFVTAS